MHIMIYKPPGGEIMQTFQKYFLALNFCKWFVFFYILALILIWVKDKSRLHSLSCTALWLQWSHSDSWPPQFLRTWSGTITLSLLWKRCSRGCTSFASWGTAEKVLLCHHWISPLHINDCLVQLSYQIWPQKTTRVVRTAERIIGTTLPTLLELYSSRVSKRTDKITLDPSHPAHSLFELLPSGRHYRALSTRTTRHRNSFFLKHSISWTLDIKRGTHNTIIHYLFTTHTYFFIFKIAHVRSHT